MRGGESEKGECLDVLYLRVPLHIYVRFLLTKPPEKQRNVVEMRRNLQKIMCRSFLGTYFSVKSFSTCHEGVNMCEERL